MDFSGFWWVLPDLSACWYILAGLGGSGWVSRFGQDVEVVRGSSWVSKGLGGSWQVMVGLGRSWQVLAGLGIS